MNHETSESETGLLYALQVLGSNPVSALKFGWAKKSAGCRLLHKYFGEVWLKVQVAEERANGSRQWNGELLSSAITGISKPRLIGHFDWESNAKIFRATIWSIAPSPVISDTPDLQQTIELPYEWWSSLRSSLQTLEFVETDRICVREDLVKRRLAERFNLQIRPLRKWQTVHGDIHWSNVTRPPLVILDWEGWGKAPYGMDVALLLAFSLRFPSIIAKIRREFEETLSHSQFDLAFLFAAAELMRMTDLYGDCLDLRPMLQLESENIIARGRINEFLL